MDFQPDEDPISPLIFLSYVANLKIFHPTMCYFPSVQLTMRFAGRFAIPIDAYFPPHSLGQGLFRHVFALQGH